jgi:hypothetical protein
VHRLVFDTRDHLGPAAFFQVARPARAPPRAAVAEPVRVLDVLGQLRREEKPRAIVLGGNQYGKAEVRLVRVDRDRARQLTTCGSAAYTTT